MRFRGRDVDPLSESAPVHRRDSHSRISNPIKNTIALEQVLEAHRSLPRKGGRRRNYVLTRANSCSTLGRILILAPERFQTSTKDDQPPTIPDIGVCALANISRIGVEYTVGNDALHSPVNGFSSFSASTELARSPSAGNLRAKRVFDVTIALIILILILPIFPLVALAVILDGGPVFYKHRRIGWRGKMFGCLKFRTMRQDADAILESALRRDGALRAEWAATRKLRNDPRVTRVGRVLRMTSLDELPQLLNVLKGDMSLVGPRPVIREELDKYYGPAASSAYMSVRPGVTGLWQVTRRSRPDYGERVMLDCAYIANMSLAKDVGLLFRTVGCLIRCDGA